MHVFKKNRRVSIKLFPIFLGISFAAIWSMSFVATKAALVNLPPFFLASTRLLLAGLCLILVWHQVIGDFFIKTSKPMLLRVAVAGLF